MATFWFRFTAKAQTAPTVPITLASTSPNLQPKPLHPLPYTSSHLLLPRHPAQLAPPFLLLWSLVCGNVAIQFPLNLLHKCQPLPPPPSANPKPQPGGFFQIYPPPQKKKTRPIWSGTFSPLGRKSSRISGPCGLTAASMSRGKQSWLPPKKKRPRGLSKKNLRIGCEGHLLQKLNSELDV